MNVDIIFENCLIKKNYTNGGLIQELKDTKQIIDPPQDDEDDLDVVGDEDVVGVDKKTNEIEPSSQDEEEIKELEFDEETLDEKNKDDITDYILNDIMENSNPNNNDTLGIVSNKLDNKTDQLKNIDTTIAIDSNVLDNDDNNDLTEITLDIEELLPESINTLEIPVMKLKKPNEVYYDLFNKAKIKAKEAKKMAIQSYLEAKKIKEAYLLEDVDLSDEDEDENDKYDKYDENDEDFEFA